MRQLIVKQLDDDLTPVAGLALVGHYLAALGPTLAQLDASLAVKGGVANRDIVRSYVGLLVQGKSDFDAIENFRGDTFYKQALGNHQRPRHRLLPRPQFRDAEDRDRRRPDRHRRRDAERPRTRGGRLPHRARDPAPDRP